MNLFLHGASIRGDTLRQPAFFLGDNLATFDCVIVNALFFAGEVGRRSRGERSLTAAILPECLPPKKRDYAWVQHMVKSMAPATGRMAVVLPHGGSSRH